MGEEREMVEKEIDLEPSDDFYRLTYLMGVTRRLLECPTCGRGLRSYRYLYGSKHEGKDI